MTSKGGTPELLLSNNDNYIINGYIVMLSFCGAYECVKYIFYPGGFSKIVGG